MMNEQSIWRYVAKLRPELRTHINITPQVYRRERWYVLKDKSSDVYMRFNERAYAILGRLDGILTLEEILEYANEEEHTYPLTEEDVTALIGQLDAAEVLRGGLPINAQDAFKQYKAQKSKKRHRSYMNPLSIKIPLFDPDRLLTTLMPLGRHLFSRMGLWILVLTLFFALLLGFTHMGQLAHDISNLSFSPTQLVVMWFVYPFIKLMHELGHGLALKTWGAEVHEVGINLLVFMPVPYVDATASLGFSNKWKRIIVGLAGILVEMSLAALALFLWLIIEAGMVKDVALNVILIATLSTLLFNGNPLLRYDGYFVLEDWLEIPNLASRAKRYYYYLIQKYILKIQTAFSPATAQGEEKWFLLYGFMAPLYRIVILLSIAMYLVDSYLVLGVMLAVWAVMMQVVIPIIKGIKFLVFSKAVAAHRIRALWFMAVLALGFVFVMAFPVSVITYTQGVVWTKNNAQITADTSGFVKKSFIPSNTYVESNQTLYQLEELELKTAYEELQYKLDELELKYREEKNKNLVKAAMLKDDIRSIEAEYKQRSKEVEKLTIKSASSGIFVVSAMRNILGEYVKKGDILGHIINPNNIIIRAVIPQARMGILERYETSVEFALAKDTQYRYKSEIIRKIPQATIKLPSAVLGTLGGGELAVDHRDEKGVTLFTPVFQVDLSLPNGLELTQIGNRVLVRLNHGKLPIGEQLALYFHQLFLRHFYAK